MAERDVTGDLPQPCAQLFWFTQFANLPPCGQKRLLRHVFARGNTAHDAQGDAADQRLVSGDDFDERLLVPSPSRTDQVGVWRRGASPRLRFAGTGIFMTMFQ